MITNIANPSNLLESFANGQIPPHLHVRLGHQPTDTAHVLVDTSHKTVFHPKHPPKN